MRLGTARVTAAAAGALLAATISAGPAQAASDTKPPSLTLLPYAQFVQGGTLAPSDFYDDTTSFTEAPMSISWKGTDNSGICGYDLWADLAYSDPENLLSNTRSRTYSAFVSDYTNQFGSGGGGWVDDWRVIAHDCAGNSTSKTAKVRPSVIQEDGSTADDYWATLTYRGQWTASQCTCYSGHGDRKTTAKGAAALITFDSAANAAVGLVMEKAPNRGKFTLLVDGVNRGTVDTFATTNLHRVIVWSGRMTSAGSHVIELVNQATAGRPRIDLDAVLRNG